mmetsp:Transcript_1721/g.3728  ORF Transcript_1721/g.3728 Transcript_1721/m.3728 type:complete len:273 (+) Transcript_1721:703-1521(+)
MIKGFHVADVVGRSDVTFVRAPVPPLPDAKGIQHFGEFAESIIGTHDVIDVDGAVEVVVADADTLLYLFDYFNLSLLGLSIGVGIISLIGLGLGIGIRIISSIVIIEVVIEGTASNDSQGFRHDVLANIVGATALLRATRRGKLIPNLRANIVETSVITRDTLKEGGFNHTRKTVEGVLRHYRKIVVTLALVRIFIAGLIGIVGLIGVGVFACLAFALNSASIDAIIGIVIDFTIDFILEFCHIPGIGGAAVEGNIHNIAVDIAFGVVKRAG